MPSKLFVTNSLAQGGAENHAVTLMNRLGERGHACHLAYLRNGNALRPKLAPRDGARIECLGGQSYLDRPALRRLASLISDVEPGLLVAANEYSLLYATIARRIARSAARIVVTYHSTRLATARERLQMLYYRPLFWAADCAVFVCDVQRRYWQRRGVASRRNEVIFNGIDTQAFAPRTAADRVWLERPHLGFAEGDFLVGIAAGLRPVKNHLQLVEALRALRDSGIPAKVLMIGDGETRGPVVSRARELGVERHLLITGFQADVRPYLALCDAAVLCSTTETLSLAAIEAMALGKPFVHSDTGGAPELIDAGSNGYLFPVGDTPALVDRLRRLADRAHAAELGRNARLTVERRFSERTMIDRYEQLFAELGGPQGDGFVPQADSPTCP